MEFEHRIGGIPCLIKVGKVTVQKPLGPSADNDLDCYGWSDVEFEVCDRRGRAAPWLERKMTSKEEVAIEDLILNMKEDDDY